MMIEAAGVCSIPIVVFLSAAVVEFKKDRQSLRNVGRILSLATALASSVFLPVSFLYLDEPSIVNRISTVMSIVSLVGGLAALFCRYKSRIAAGLIVFGGLVVAYLWLISRYRP